MIVVLDASAAIEIAMDRGKAARLADEIEAAGSVLSPDVLVPEVSNAIWKYQQFHNLEIADGEPILDRALRLVDELVPSRQLFRDALTLARMLRKPVYDMFYLALARREGAILMTLDPALKKDAERQGVQVI